MSSSVTTFSGRRCTKVRRNVTAPAGSSIAMTLSGVSTTSTSSSTISLSSTTLAGAAAPNAGNGNSAAAAGQSTTSTSTLSTSSTLLRTTTTPAQTTFSTQATFTSSTLSTLQSITTLAPVATTALPAPAASRPPPSLSPPTPPPGQGGTDPNSSSPDDDPGTDDPGTDPGPDDPEPAIQSSVQPNAQNTLPAVSIASSAAPRKSHDPQTTMTVDPMTIPISSTAVPSVTSPLAISVPSRTSTLASSVVPSATGVNPTIGASGSSNGPGVMNKAAVAGGIVGSLVGAFLLFGLLFLFFRRKFQGGKIRLRRRSNDGLLLSRDDGPSSSSELIGKIGRVVSMLDVRKYIKGRQPSVYEGPSPNPAFSNFGTRTPSPQMSSPRRRSWSAPTPTFRERLQAAAAAFPVRAIPRKPVGKGFVVQRRSPSTSESPPQLPPVFQRQNGSVSSIARAVYSPEADDYLNPFRDPDPSAPLRIINSDPSRQGTPSVTPMQNDRVIFNPAYKVSPTPTQPQPLHQRLPSQTQDPFLDPTESIGTALPLGMNPPTTSSDNSSRHRTPSISSLHSNRSSVGPLPQIPTLQPSQQGQGHVPQLSNASSNYSSTGDSGFASASMDVSPISPKEAPAESPLPTLAPPSAFRTPQWMAYQPSPRMQPPMSALRTPQGMAYQPSPAMTGPMSALRGSKFSFDLNTLGEPGPTRPNTYLYDMVTPGANTRMSDPFDLDKPELLGFMSSDPNGNKRNGRNSRRKNSSVSNWPKGPTFRSVLE